MRKGILKQIGKQVKVFLRSSKRGLQSYGGSPGQKSRRTRRRKGK